MQIKKAIQLKARATSTVEYNRQYRKQQHVAGKREYEELLTSSDSHLGDGAVSASSIATGRTPITSVGNFRIATVTLSEC